MSVATPPLNRRALNRAALALALGAWLAPRGARAQAAPRWTCDPFVLGVASGQPRSDSVVLWTRLAPQNEDESARSARPACEVRYEIYSDEALRHPLRQGAVTTGAARAHSVHVALSGLAPQREYWYRFTCGDAVSPVGRTRTAPAAEAQPARLAFALASCQNYEHGRYAAHREIARSALDFVLFVGDYIYEGNSAPDAAVRRHGLPVAQTLADYRARHALYKGDADLQAAHAAHPWILTWDDHEVVNDYAGEREPARSDAATFLRRRAAAYQAYFEHMPLAVGPEGASLRIHDRFDWGRLATLWTLDCRQFKSSHACPDPRHDAGRIRTLAGCPELADPARSLLGAAQERWLADGLRQSQQAHAGGWKLLGQSTQMASAGHGSGAERSAWTDGWDGYPAARERLLDNVAEAGVRNLVVLGGDVHRHVAAQLRARAGQSESPVLAAEFVATSVSSRGAVPEATAAMQRHNPDVLHARSDERGYALLEVTPQATRCTLRAVADPTAADSALHTQARFVVEAGRAGVQPA